MLEKIQKIMMEYKKDSTVLDKYSEVEKYLILELIKLTPKYEESNKICIALGQQLKQASAELNNLISIQNKFIEDLSNLLEKDGSNE